jgi:hypothetical protein
MSSYRSSSHTERYSIPRFLIAFLSGAISVLLFHQGVLTILSAVGFTTASPFPTKPTHPLGLPQIWSLAFWGGIWGIVFAVVDRWFPKKAGYWISALLFGAIGPSVVAWLIVLPLKGLPAGGGWHPAGMAVGLMVNGAWGLGCAFLLRGLTAGWLERSTLAA